MHNSQFMTLQGSVDFKKGLKGMSAVTTATEIAVVNKMQQGTTNTNHAVSHQGIYEMNEVCNKASSPAI
jgi:hypothetical protein